MYELISKLGKLGRLYTGGWLIFAPEVPYSYKKNKQQNNKIISFRNPV